MKFGEVNIVEALGSILARTTNGSSRSLKKGQAIGIADVDELTRAGIGRVIVATLEAGDIPENEAARFLANHLGSDGIRVAGATTGRVNFHANGEGLFTVNKEAVDKFNSVSPEITLATLADRTRVRSNDLVATVKIIPLAVRMELLESAVGALAGFSPLNVKPFRRHDVFLIATHLPSLKPSVLEKTARSLGQRLEDLGSSIAAQVTCGHSEQEVAAHIKRMAHARGACPPLIIIFGASAVADDRDVVPEAIRLSGGRVIRVGMPVDPGNLLVLGEAGGVPIVGAPGCARSPSENGFDIVLRRLLAGESPLEINISAMGVGGLLTQTKERAGPVEPFEAKSPIEVAAVVLAAGTSSRMGDDRHKLLATFNGVPLVTKVASAAVNSRVADVIVVTGHKHNEISDALVDLPVNISHNRFYRSGMATSLACGIRRAAEIGCAGVVVLLADMPSISSTEIDRLTDVFIKTGGRAVVRACAFGRPGNPVIMPRSLFEAAMELKGDVGAKGMIEQSGIEIVDVELGAMARIDVDTPESLMAAGGTLQQTKIPPKQN